MKSGDLALGYLFAMGAEGARRCLCFLVLNLLTCAAIAVLVVTILRRACHKSRRIAVEGAIPCAFGGVASRDFGLSLPIAVEGAGICTFDRD